MANDDRLPAATTAGNFTDDELVRYAKERMGRIRSKLAHKALCSLTGGKTPKKKTAGKLRNSDAYRAALDSLCLQDRTYQKYQQAVDGDLGAMRQELTARRQAEEVARRKKEEQARLEEEFRLWCSEFDLDAFLEGNLHFAEEALEKAVVHYLTADRILVCTGYEEVPCGWGRPRYEKAFHELDAGNIQFLLDPPDFSSSSLLSEGYLASIAGYDDDLDGYLADQLLSRSPEIQSWCARYEYARDWFFDKVYQSGTGSELGNAMERLFPEERVMSLLRRNPHYTGLFRKLEEEALRARERARAEEEEQRRVAAALEAERAARKEAEAEAGAQTTPVEEA